MFKRAKFKNLGKILYNQNLCSVCFSRKILNERKEENEREKEKEEVNKKSYDICGIY